MMANCSKGVEYVKGQKLLITLSDERILEGTFMQENKLRSSIVLHKVSYVPFNGKSFSQLEFKSNDIAHIHCIEEDVTEEARFDQSLDTSSPHDVVKESGNPFYGTIKDRVSNHVFIDKIDETFSKAVNDIQSQQCVAVTGEGSNEGRFSQLTILGLATRSSIYLFDMINLGQRAFKALNSAVKKILESNQFLKVVHNCRLLSDCLKHKYQINLTNVFDTQACHLIVLKYRSGHPILSAGFSELVSEYLKLPNAICENQVWNPDVWCRRPLQEGMAETVAWKVALLRELKPRMDDALYAPFDRLCQFYLSSVRDLDDEFKIRSIVSRGEEAVPKEILSSELEVTHHS